ncbi:immunity 8 family protein [Phytoactinopolyspora endophytica]|uniref:immunity 8 family protein n=1 Tax=Phytoactinopolyspora endophytica TaxID=1642495 RepID=UPI00197C46B9|nr:immunity 8 family protein [Phytoactinopolyspora endophytica]
MRAAIRSFYSADVDIDAYVPEDPENDGVWLRLLVGPADGPGEESFDVLVCTPLWLRKAVSREGPRIGRHHLIVDPFDLSEAKEFLARQVASVEAPDWPTLGDKLARLGYWEFEDYQP